MAAPPKAPESWPRDVLTRVREISDSSRALQGWARELHQRAVAVCEGSQQLLADAAAAQENSHRLRGRKRRGANHPAGDGEEPTHHVVRKP